jgi:hypothetical protein
MNPEEAKLILQCRRPCGKDDHDAAIREALEVLSGDCKCMETLRCEERLDAVIGERLRTLDPPLDLRRKILVGARVSTVKQWWKRPWWIAAAAALAVGVPLAIRYLPGSRPGSVPLIASALTEFRITTTQKLNEGPKLEMLPTIDEVKAHLAVHSTTKSLPLPEHLCDCTDGTVGCEVFDWHGKEVTLICFKAGKNGIVHLFTVDASVLDAFPAKAVCVPLNGWQTRAWVQDGKLMMLAGSEKEATEEDLKSLVE